MIPSRFPIRSRASRWSARTSPARCRWSIPGPYVVSVLPEDANGATIATKVALNTTVSALRVTFDRDMDPSTFMAADIVRLVGPLGEIKATVANPNPFTVTVVPGTNNRVFRVTIPTQSINGTYVLTLGSDIRSKPTAAAITAGEPAAGYQMDTNWNAGLDVLLKKTDPINGQTINVQPYGGGWRRR